MTNNFKRLITCELTFEHIRMSWLYHLRNCFGSASRNKNATNTGNISLCDSMMCECNLCCVLPTNTRKTKTNSMEDVEDSQKSK